MSNQFGLKSLKKGAESPTLLIKSYEKIYLENKSSTMPLHTFIPMHHSLGIFWKWKRKKSNLLFILSGQINHGFQLGGD